MAEAGGPGSEQAGILSGGSVPVTGNGAPASDQAMAAAQPVAQWAWLSIAAMAVPLAALILVVLL
jgi:hypothetical protein